ncbi:M67 family metallopeptidase [Thermococcus sp.]|uniref:M67 family metallopeptidase n=1 Tax=Thermococcus sp. TaxID=35749 RepID=UPI00260BAA4A|nr:M67 family metallopeptidase [Thermococcus sp.]
MRLLIRQEDLGLIIERARASKEEICGFLLGVAGEEVEVREVRFVRNRLASPVEFEMEPLEMVEALDEAEEKGLEVVGIFHSHLKCPPRPSGSDLKGMELWPVTWLIVDEKGNCAAYILRGSRVEEVEVVEVENVNNL